MRWKLEKKYKNIKFILKTIRITNDGTALTAQGFYGLKIGEEFKRQLGLQTWNCTNCSRFLWTKNW